MGDAENPIVCLNYCMTDLDTGYCLTCGRPPIPVAVFNPKMFGKISLQNMTMVASKTPDGKQDTD